jgi:hypothetical protein
MSNEIREAVQMVLTRMETHPDDFYSRDVLHTFANAPRFGWVWEAINGSSFSYGLNEAELAAIKQGYDGVMYRKFHDRVLESLLDGPKGIERDIERMVRQGNSLKPPTKLLISDSQLNSATQILTNSSYKTP